MNNKWFLLSIVFTFLGCFKSTDNRQSGTTDTGNIPSILGQVMNEDGTGAMGLTVIINDETYLASGQNLFKTSSLPNTLTDKEGFFQFPMQRPGTYLVEATDGNMKSVLFKVQIDEESRSISLKPKIIDQMQKVQGQVAVENGQAKLNVQVYGMERIVHADSVTGEYALMLPPGEFNIRISSPNNYFLPFEFNRVSILATATNTLPKVSLVNISSPFFQWKYSQQISINTQSFVERAIKYDLKFPLYLELDSTTSNLFDFTQANPDGSDLRFSNSKGTELPYEIEYWNAQQKIAHIWVLVDTVFNLNDSQYITMYTGNPLATARSFGPSTFKTMAGTFHFSSPTSAPPSLGTYANSSSDRDNLTGKGPLVVEGKIHTGLKFKESDYLILESPSDAYLPRDSYTISFWLRMNSSPPPGSRIVSMGNNITINITSKGRVQADFNRIPASNILDTVHISLQSSTKNMDNGMWRHVTFRITDNSADLFIDGKEDTALVFETGSIAYQAAPVIIGKNDGVDSVGGFQGEIDELRISPFTRSIFWNLLNYETQNLNRKIITLRKSKPK
jgi:Concanavalin A-like lectin/glucanases superfamily/Domain of unknown function (DUF2341)